MAEHVAGVRCLDCPQIVSVPVDIQTHHDAMGEAYESVEVDMRGWQTHAAKHREADHGAWPGR